MSSLLELHRDPIHAGAHVKALPRWLPPVPTKGIVGTYWHIPRSASLKADGSMHVTFWCGPGRRYEPGAFVGSSEPPAELRCGTCLGRRLGYDREQGAIFRPRDHFGLPRVCPSTTPGPDDRHCMACGRRCNYTNGFNRWGLARHRPEPELAERCRPCPQHGWKDAAERGDRIVCAVWQCGRDLGPGP